MSVLGRPFVLYEDVMVKTASSLEKEVLQHLKIEIRK